ncbi:hypothetical protein DYB28_002502 [Aphanomyces astaci]|uniref:Fibronectin type-III domain-containing protein n=1 Tax=Aphanomyces astaci TaxID=112090 RepID=A0A9X8EFQ4_APHAT|nr:hypothetical protein DYB28_002502 [Aphanomyces astaci]
MWCANDFTHATCKAPVFVVQGLVPATLYEITVQAANDAGWSDTSAPLVVKTAGWSDLGDVSDGITTNGTFLALHWSFQWNRLADAPKLVHKTGTSLRLVWPKPYSTHDIDMYELQCKVAATTDWSVVSSRIRGQSHTVSQLSPATGYVFRVRPHFANMRQATPDPPSDVVLVSRSQSMLEVRWKMPRCNGHVVLHYELQKQRMDEVKSTQSILSDAKPDPAAPWESVSNTIEVDCATYRVQGLMHGTPYRFRLRARNALGWSVDGDPSVAFFTHAFLPPTPPLATAKTHYSLDIAWRDQQADVNNNVDLKEYFELHLCRLWTYCPHDAIPDIRLDTWDVVQDRCPTRSCVVSNLSALSWYAFRVRSWIRHRGWTEFSDPSRPIQTLRRM